MTIHRQTDHLRGEEHPRAKLTDEQVYQMRLLYDQGKCGYGILAIAFGCGVSTARDICKGRTRK
jgi:hypothetical protein